MSDEMIIEKGDYLIKEGEDSTEMYFLKQGTMEVLKKRGLIDQTIGNIYSGELVGEMSFLDKEPRCASVRALTQCELVVIKHEKLEKIVNTLPSWYKALVSTLLDRLRRANAKVKV